MDSRKNFFWAIALAAWASGPGCKLDANYDGTRYRCDESGTCPDGYSCINGYCEQDMVPQDPDGGVIVPGECGTLARPYENFESPVIDDGHWEFIELGGATVAHVDGFLAFNLPIDSALDTSATYYSKQRYRLGSSGAYVEVEPLATPGDVAFMFALETSADEAWYFERSAGELVFGHALGRDIVESSKITYVPEVHRWWQIRSDGDTIYWETSPDAGSWEPQFMTRLDSPEALVRLQFSARGGLFSTVDTIITMDEVNGGQPSGVPWCPIATLVDDFDDGQAARFWTVREEGMCRVLEQGGRLVFAYFDQGEGDCRYASASNFDMINGTITVQGPSADPGDASVLLNLDLANSDDFGFEITGGLLTGQKEIGGASSRVFSVPFDPDIHRWLRFRHEDTVLSWETSTDGQTWNPLGTHESPQIGLDDAGIELRSYANGVAPTIISGFDNLNTQQ